MKISIVGAGNVGATVAQAIALKELADQIVLLDIRENLAEGKALDLWQTAPIFNFNSRVIGITNDYEYTKNSNVVVITSGVPRKPGMSRDDLIAINAGIVKQVTQQLVTYSPDAKIIVVSNPLDVMTYVAYLASKFEPNRVMGMAGILDSARYKAFIADELNCSPNDIQALLLGGHGDTMVPLPRYTTVSGIPVTQLISVDKLDAIIQRTRNGGAEIVNLLGTSAWYAPGAATVEMVQAIVRDQKRIFPCCAFLQGQYGVNGLFVGVPVKLGKNGVEQIIEIELNEHEKKLFENSVNSVKALMNVLDQLQIF